MQPPDQRWVEHIQQYTPETQLYTCEVCPQRPCFYNNSALSQHIYAGHQDTSQVRQVTPTTSWNMIRETTSLSPPEQQEMIAQELKVNIAKLEKQAQTTQDYDLKSKLSSDLMEGYFDYLLISHLPFANSTHRTFASLIPDQVWLECINPCLITLREHSPHSHHSMMRFINSAYGVLSELYEIVPRYKMKWTKYLGYLSSQRLHIEDDAVARETTVMVTRQWYLEASRLNPSDGDIHLSLALALPNVFERQFYFSKALCVVVPSPHARDSFVAFLQHHIHEHRSPLVSTFLKAHGHILANSNIEVLQSTIQEFDSLISQSSIRLNGFIMDSSYYIALSNIAAMFGFGHKENPLMQSLHLSGPVSEMEVTINHPLYASFLQSERLANDTFKIVLRQEDLNLLPFIHCMLVFINFMSRPYRIQYLENFPWLELVKKLNSVGPHSLKRYRDIAFPVHHQLFPEDRAMRGLLWAKGYYLYSWFEKHIDNYPYTASLAQERKERILWLGFRIADTGKWIYYNEEICQFSLVIRWEH